MAVDLIALAALGLWVTVTVVLVTLTGRAEDRRPPAAKATPAESAQSAPESAEDTRP